MSEREMNRMSTTFSKDTIQFLVENRMRNDKAWFTEHKQQYNELVIEPLVALAAFSEPVKTFL